jgi:transcriptional regulator with XRE-family HTH domain
MEILLWELRTSKGLTLIELEERSGVSKSEINAIENAKVSPRLDTLQMLAHALDCRICDLYRE